MHPVLLTVQNRHRTAPSRTSSSLAQTFPSSSLLLTQINDMSHQLLKGKKGIIFGALDEKSIAWKTALKCYEEGAQIVLSNAPVALRMGEINKLAEETGAKIIGWFHGRLSSPEISSEKTSDGQTLINIEGSAITVPTLAVWAKNTELPAKLDSMIQEEFISRGNQFAGVAYFIGDSKDRKTQAVMDERNPSFDDKFFERYMLWVGVAKDKAYATVSTWSFRTMQGYQDYAKCIGDSGVAGMVTTNSNAYIAGPPKFQNGDLAYKVASPHYDSKGQIQIGTYDLAIRSDIARCIYGFTSAPIQATLSVVYADGEAKKATTLVSEKNNWLRLSAKGFTYSNPTIKVRLSQEGAPTPSQTATAAKPAAAKKTSITCVKGKTTKKITAVNPKCPTGYKKR